MPKIEIAVLKNDISLTQKKVLQIIKENIKKELQNSIMLETDFSSIGVNSGTFIKIVVALEDEFDFEFDDDMLLFTAFPLIKSLSDYVETKINQ